MIAISILGPVVVTDGDGERRIPPGKVRELLVRLALDAGVEVRTDRLIDDLWGDEVVGRNTVQSKVSMLRRALGESVSVVGSRTGYTLVADADDIDAIVALRRQEAAQSRLSSGDAAAAQELAAAGLAMFHGEVLPEAGEGAWLEPHRTRLEEARLTLLETKLSAAVDVNPPGSTIAELEELVRRHPLRERLWELLITALYRAQRQADALAAHRRISRILDEELGLAPGPPLRGLEQMVLEQDPSLESTVTAAAAPALPPRGNLPSLTSDLIGRDDELVSLTTALTDCRLVTIVGPAGVGKTRLAIEVARVVHPDAAWLVRLEAAKAPTQLAALAGDALGLNGATRSMVIDRLRVATGLVILDNCEHVVDGVAALASTILDNAPGVRLLTTSQVPLDLDGEVIHALRPLPLEASISLFAERSRKRRRSFSLDGETADAVEKVCRALDGLPLAIELAAARTKVLSVQEISRRLDDRFGLLNDSAARGPERHRALSTAISWSFDLLFPDDKQVLFAIAAFTDGAPLAGVEHVATALGVPEAAVVDSLGRLADRSLVTVDVGDAGAVRYRLLESVRLFALDTMAADGLVEAARAEHAAWFAAQALVAQADERGPRQAHSLSFVRSERANIDAALQWAAVHDPLLGVRMTRGYGWSWVILGEAQVAADRLRAAIAAADDLITLEDRAVVLSHIAWNEAGADLAQARASASASATAAATDDVSSYAFAESQFSLAFVMLQSGRASDGVALLRSWRAAGLDDATPWQVGTSCMLLGYCGIADGQIEVARVAAAEGAELLPRVGDNWLHSHIESIRGQLALGEGLLDAATSHLFDAASAARASGLLAAEAFHLVSLGRVQQLAGELGAAVATLEAAAAAAETVGLMRVVAIAQVQLGRVLICSGELDEAREVLTEVSRWFAASGGGESASLAECLLATLPGGSRERLEELLDDARERGDVEVQVLCLDAMALHDATAGDESRAGLLLAEADQLAVSVGHRVAPVDRVDAERARVHIAAHGQ